MKKAFSILEMLLVMAIITFLLLLAIPHISNHKTDKLKHFLATLTLTCRFVQQSAYASQQKKTIMFDPSKNLYVFTKNNQQITCPLPEHFAFEANSNVYGPPASPTQPIKAPCTFPKNEENKTYLLTFYPNGNAAVGTLYILDKETNTLGALTCGVSQVSYIRTYVYQEKGWHLITPLN